LKVEKHDSHGLQLVVGMHPEEALALARKLVESVEQYQQGKSSNNFYVSIPCLFEDDNDRWAETDFTVVVGNNRHADYTPTYPCGKPVEAMGAIPAGPCDLQEEHGGNCFRSNAKPSYGSL
jgi:hypothetical protein